MGREFITEELNWNFCTYLRQPCTYADKLGECVLGYCKVEDEDWVEEDWIEDDEY
ncbi:MAG: hypothetical protein LBR20_03640 [Propionibacteriaceae bacterium]|jgi:hypothetical protein|nr:hypothetical protein [Propionibacteriaceae bacterium]